MKLLRKPVKMEQEFRPGLFVDDRVYREQEELHLLLLFLCHRKKAQVAELERVCGLEDLR